MKKILLMLITISLISSCDTGVTPGKMEPNYVGEIQCDEIRYFQDKKTLKCFAERGISNKYSFTCVPCDSLVMTQINKNK